MKLRHIDEIMMARRQKSLSKFMESRFDSQGCDDWIKEAIIGLFALASLLLLVALISL